MADGTRYVFSVEKEEMSDPLSEAARIMGRKGGSAKSEAKTRANREKAKLPRPNARGKRGPRKPKQEETPPDKTRGNEAG